MRGQSGATVGDDQQRQIGALFRDLRAFREEDAPLFFGRAAFTERLVAAVQGRCLAAIAGPSGSGRCSVVQAGLIPRLGVQGGWEVGILRPGGNPWRSLAACLSGLLGDEPEGEPDRLRTIEQATRGAGPDRRPPEPPAAATLAPGSACGKDGLPDIAWGEIPGGEVVPGSQHRVGCTGA